VLVTDPYSAEVGYELGSPSADVVTVSQDHPGHNNADSVQGFRKVLRGPGEYEIGGVLIEGFRTITDEDDVDTVIKNTAYVVQMDGLTVCHLGGIRRVPGADQVAELGGVDVLLIPVGGGDAMDASAAQETIALLGPRIVMPMHYNTSAVRVPGLAAVDSFLRLLGVKDVEPQARFSVTTSNLPNEMRIVLLQHPPGKDS